MDSKLPVAAIISAPILGVLMSISSGILAWGGHGSYLAVNIISSPLYIFGYLIALFGAPYWLVLGVLLASIRTKVSAILFILIYLIPSYAGIGVSVITAEPEDFHQLSMYLHGGKLAFALILLPALFFIAGQFIIWWAFYRTWRKSRLPSTPGQSYQAALEK